MCNALSHTIIGQSLKTTFAELHLKRRNILGDGHCILSSWRRATDIPIESLKNTIWDHYCQNKSLYYNFGSKDKDLELYLQKRHYNMIL